jgi:hypothetical protein
MQGSTMKGVFLLACALAASLGVGCRSYPMPSTPGVSTSAQLEHGDGLSHIRFRREVCAGVPMAPEVGQLSFEKVVAFLRENGFTGKISRERADLQYIDVPVDAKHSVRLRIAVLPSAARAGEDLHEGMTRQGTGSWGVHRGNVAILGPVGHVDDIVDFAAKTKLACWGLLSIQDGDDTIAVPGAYLEF